MAIFQLKANYIGFAFPFVVVGAWYLIRAYRLQQELKRAEASDAPPPRRNSGRPAGSRPRPNKRYTPPT